MRRVSYRNWFSPEWQQIYDTRDQATATEAHTASLQRQVDALSVMVMSLVEMLAKANLLDEPTWRAMVEELRPAAPTVTSAETPAYVCIRCQRRVAPANTTMTAEGVVCDACSA